METPLTHDDWDVILNSLCASGWMPTGDRVVAPFGTIWFYRQIPWNGSLEDFWIRMKDRLKRLLANREDPQQQAFRDSWNKSAHDLTLLLNCIADTLDQFSDDWHDRKLPI